MVRFISFEGGDGTGKSTQLKILDGHLRKYGRICVATREPGGTSLGHFIRQVLLDVGDQSIASPTELFLYLADRAQHVSEVIAPAIASGKIVLCDRYTDSTLAYQGYGRGIDLNLLRRLNEVANRGTYPDLTLLFDCPVEVGLSRTNLRNKENRGGKHVEDRFERERVEFHERVRQGFLELAQAEPERFRVINASGTVSEVRRAVQDIIHRELKL